MVMRVAKTIGICGKARSGKDTFARFLATALRNRGYDVCVIHLAGPLREMLTPLISALAPPSEPQPQFLTRCFQGDRKEQPLSASNRRTSPRYLMQTLGTDWGREMIDPDLWVKVLDSHIRVYMEEELPWEYDRSETTVFIVPDVRFDNEAEYLGGDLIKVVRPNAEEVNTHSSEDGISEDWVGVVVYNDEGLEELADAAEVVAEEFHNDGVK